jgi:hypothetical protein
MARLGMEAEYTPFFKGGLNLASLMVGPDIRQANYAAPTKDGFKTRPFMPST